ncbi:MULTISPECIES: hypothetical protein [unclassified Streptomyces]|uniref:hypothetical protein n=1 Tax=unclassified Streptomyces TaxID=2593676 RepID=UPI0009397E44|nr:hypothetical protein [Streptomyces sp. TSRI0281]OKI40557.1 hypothetical protein A6A29_39265 [Streptomyces sp. TSRI0281]
MELYLGISVVLVALLIAASGVAALTRGWVLASNRSPVRRPRLHGWGQSAVAFALCWQTLFLLALDGTGTRQWGTLTGSVLLLSGLVLMMVSRRKGGNRQECDTS